MAKYQEIKDWLKESLNEGFYSKDDKIPSENELVNLFKVSRHTVRRAISDMINEGLLYTKKGSGIYYTGSLETKRKEVAFITHTPDHFIFPEILKGAYEELYKNNTDLLIYYSNYNVDQEKNILTSLFQKKIDGIIINPVISSTGEHNYNTLKELKSNRVPIVLLDNLPVKMDFSMICPDEFTGGTIAAKFIYELGHRNIGLISGFNQYCILERARGAISYFESHGLKQNKQLNILKIDLHNIENQKEKIRVFINNINKPFAVFCTTDELSLLTANIILSEGLKIPEDISIIGYGNSKILEYTKTNLTSVSFPKETIGKIAAQYILNEIEFDQTSLTQKNIIRPSIVDRGSVGNLIN